MRWIRRLRRVPPAERALLVRAAVLLGLVRLGLAVLPLRVVRRRLLSSRRKAPAPRDGAPSKDRIAWAVTTVRRFVPGTTCLAQALVTEALLARNGHSSTLRIGIAKTDAGALQAHAWVESDGRVLVGVLADLSRYTRLPALPGAER